jgi:hypothetical protein
MIVIGAFVLLLGIIGGDGYFVPREIKISIGVLLVLYGLYVNFMEIKKNKN